jgi:hypothetical protein
MEVVSTTISFVRAIERICAFPSPALPTPILHSLLDDPLWACQSCRPTSRSSITARTVFPSRSAIMPSIPMAMSLTALYLLKRSTWACRVFEARVRRILWPGVRVRGCSYDEATIDDAGPVEQTGRRWLRRAVGSAASRTQPA